MQRHTTLSTESKNDLNSINKGAELMMRKKSSFSNSPKLKKRRTMEQAVLALSVMVGILTLGLGLVIGYLFRSYIHDTTPQYSHPEMYDANGNPLPDELIAFRFDPDRLHDDDDDD
tara:strand:- start:149 stop:496 length:348 start_codon:yes stop_codon:yes gene_type:complete